MAYVYVYVVLSVMMRVIYISFLAKEATFKLPSGPSLLSHKNTYQYLPCGVCSGLYNTLWISKEHPDMIVEVFFNT